MPKYKLSEADVKWVCLMWDTGVLNQNQLAKALGVTRSHICRLVAGGRRAAITSRF